MGNSNKKDVKYKPSEKLQVNSDPEKKKDSRPIICNDNYLQKSEKSNSNKKDAEYKPTEKSQVNSEPEKKKDSPPIICNDNYLQKSDKSNDICMTCKNNLSQIFYFKLPKCCHIFCTECMCSHVEKAMEEAKEKEISPKIQCPLKECTQRLSDNIIRQCLTDVEIESYDRLCNGAVAVKCLITECNYFVVIESTNNHYDCPICKQPNCLSCSKLHKKDQPCGTSPDEAQFQQKGLDNLNAIRNENWRQRMKNSNLLYNAEKSNCQICESFLIPRQGIQVNECLHNFCRECLIDYMTVLNNIFQLKCPVCKAKPEDRECRELMGDKKFDDLNLKGVGAKFFSCKSPNCEAIWDPGQYTGLYTCPRCSTVNCIDCCVVHMGQSCSEYKKSEAYQKFLLDQKFLEKTQSVKCYFCETTIYVKEGGCGSLHCENCLRQVCQFTGLAVGPQGCKCTPGTPCHKNCTHGCFPDKR